MSPISYRCIEHQGDATVAHQDLVAIDPQQGSTIYALRRLDTHAHGGDFTVAECVGDMRHNTAVVALFHAFEQAILMEALERGIHLCTSEWTPEQGRRDLSTCVKVVPSTAHEQVFIQLRPGDSFLVSPASRFSVEAVREGKVEVASSPAVPADHVNPEERKNNGLVQTEDDGPQAVLPDKVQVSRSMSSAFPNAGTQVARGFETQNGYQRLTPIPKDQDKEMVLDTPALETRYKEGDQVADSEATARGTDTEPFSTAEEVHQLQSQTSLQVAQEEVSSFKRVDMDKRDGTAGSEGILAPDETIKANNLNDSAASTEDDGEDLDLNATDISERAKYTQDKGRDISQSGNTIRNFSQSGVDTNFNSEAIDGNIEDYNLRSASRKEDSVPSSTMDSTSSEYSKPDSTAQYTLSQMTESGSLRKKKSRSSDAATPSTKRKRSQPPLYSGHEPTIVFSNSTVKDRPQLIKFLKGQKAKISDHLEGADFLCVKNGELKKTAKLMMAVAFGVPVICDEWIVESSKHGHLLEPFGFMTEDPTREENWGFKLSDAVKRGQQGIRILADTEVFLTPSLKKELGPGLAELKSLCVAAGAQTVSMKIPRDTSESIPNGLVLAATHDVDASTLTERGWNMYQKELISFSILRGKLIVDTDEFKIPPTSSMELKGGTKRKRG